MAHNKGRKDAIRNLWFNLEPGDIICNSIRNPEHYFTATVIRKKGKGVFSLSIFSKSKHISNVPLAEFYWDYERRSVFKRGGKEAEFLNQIFWVKKAKDLEKFNKRFFLSGSTRLTNEEIKQITKKRLATCQKIVDAIENNEKLEDREVSARVMDTIYGIGNYTKEELILTNVAIYYQNQKVTELAMRLEKMRHEFERQIKKDGKK